MSGVALLLAAVGSYGLASFGVAQRVREVGIRMAIGARPADIVRLFVSRGLVLAAAGLVGGVIAAGHFRARLTTGDDSMPTIR